MRSIAMAIDVGGAFPELLAMLDGKVVTGKIPSRREEAYRSVEGAEHTGGVAGDVVFDHVTTHGLHAVLARCLPKVAFLGKEGHRDVVEGGIGRIRVFAGPTLATEFEADDVWELRNAEAVLSSHSETEQPAYEVKFEGTNPLLEELRPAVDLLPLSQ